MKVGKAVYGSNYKKKKYAKLKDGEAAYRILPPLGESKKWSVFWNVHYGYHNSAGKLRTFASPLVKRNNMIEVPDAALERIERCKAQMEAAKAAGNKELYDKLFLMVGGPKPKINMDKNHFMNAIDAAGNIVVLQLRHRAKVALEAEIEALVQKGVDPLSAENGRYFVFRRTGMGLDTSFKVSVAQETINVPGVGEVKRDMTHVLTPELISRLSSEAGVLEKLYKTPSSSEVARIVAEGPTAVDEILDAKGGSDADDMDDATEVAPVATKSTSLPCPVVKAAPLTVQAAVQAVQSTTVTPVVQTTTPAVAAMTDEEFLKSMGL